eukprot:5338488-Amphidinium_carterae.2
MPRRTQLRALLSLEVTIQAKALRGVGGPSHYEAVPKKRLAILKSWQRCERTTNAIIMASDFPRQTNDMQ